MSREACVKSVVSILANDRVLHFLEPFLRSLRTHMPLQEVVMIPYDGASDEASRLAEAFGVPTHNPLSVLELIDTASSQIHGFSVGHFRKLAALSLEADAVLMLDIDVILLDSLRGVFEAFHRRRPDLLFAERSTDFVYSGQGKSRFPESALFNTGFVMLDPNTHSLDTILETATLDIHDFREVSHLPAYDQPLLNLYADMNGVNCVTVDQVTGSYTGTSYFKNPKISVIYDGFPPTGRALGRDALMLHYAGLGDYSGDFAHKEAVDYYRSASV
jgi:hypothetical protein